MKGSTEHPILWQKRNEWLIEDDPQTDWQQMQSLLDTHMPVSNGASSGSGNAGLSGGVSGIKLISAFIVAFSAAAIIYFVVRHNKAVNGGKQLKQKTEQVTKAGITATNSVVQPANKPDGANNGKPDDVGNNNSTSATNTLPTGSSTTNGTTGNNTASARGNKVVAIDAMHPADVHAINADKKSANVLLAKAGANTNTGATLVASNSTALSKANNKFIKGNTQGGDAAATDKNKLTGGTRGNGSIVAHSSATKIAGVNSPDVKTGTGSVTAPIGKNTTAKRINGLNKAGLNTTMNGASHSSINHHNTLLAGAGSSGLAGGGYANKLTGVGLNSSKSAKYNKGYKAGSSQRSSLRNAHNSEVKGGGTVSKNQVGNGITPNNIDQPGASANTPNQPQYYGTAIDVAPLHFTRLDKPLNGTIKNTGRSVQVTVPIPVPDKKPKSTNPQKLELGILAGVNAPGSFTAKSENANFYGSLPVDAFLGVFANYIVYKKWGINIQPKMLSPQSISGTYSHVAVSKIDSGKTFMVTDSRKIYFVDVPLHLVYNATPNISLMGGAAISFPVKDANGSSLLVPNTALKDSAYYVKVRSTISATKFSTQPNFGLSGGVSFHYWRLYLNATYLKALKPQTISSDLGSYTFNHDALQFSLGVRLK